MCCSVLWGYTAEISFWWQNTLHSSHTLIFDFFFFFKWTHAVQPFAPAALQIWRDFKLKQSDKRFSFCTYTRNFLLIAENNRSRKSIWENISPLFWSHSVIVFQLSTLSISMLHYPTIPHTLSFFLSICLCLPFAPHPAPECWVTPLGWGTVCRTIPLSLAHQLSSDRAAVID